MGKGYGCSNFQCSQMQLNSYTVAAVVHPIFNRQVTKEEGLHVLYTTVGSPCMLYM